MFYKLTLVIALSFVSLSARADLSLFNNNGVSLINDSTMNVTFIADAGLSGNVNFYGAKTWIDNLNANNYGGYNNWQLPTGDGSLLYYGSNYALSTSMTDNQLGYLFYNELGNIPGMPMSNPGLFSNMKITTMYWSSSTFATYTPMAYVWDPGLSGQGWQLKNETLPPPTLFGALAVRSNITPVPEPNTNLMLFMGLGLFGFMVRRHKKQYQLTSQAITTF